MDVAPPPSTSPAPQPAALPGASPPRRRPRLRGVSHALAAVAAVPAAWALVAGARGVRGTAAAVVYGSTVVLLFTVSAVYHRVFWPLSVRRIIGRVDHSAIFLLIAGTYTPFCLAIGGSAGQVLLILVWLGALAGIVTVVGWTSAPKPVRASLYVLLGWFVVPVLPAIHAAVGPAGLALLLVGGLLYTVGAVVYALRRPDPYPAVFGFHEIFHLLVIAAAVCHYLVVAAAVRTIG